MAEAVSPETGEQQDHDEGQAVGRGDPLLLRCCAIDAFRLALTSGSATFTAAVLTNSIAAPTDRHASPAQRAETSCPDARARPVFSLTTSHFLSVAAPRTSCPAATAIR